MTTRLASSVKGAIHDVARLKDMGGEPCHVLLVSEATLNIIQNYAIDEVTFTNRFGVLFSGDFYEPVTPSHADYDFVLDAIRDYRLEVNDVTCDIIAALSGIEAAISGSAAADCSCQIGTDVETTDGEEGGDLPLPVNGVPYEEKGIFADRKCLAANYIHQAVRDTVNELKLNRADQYTFAGLQFVLTLLTTVIGGLIAGPFGLLVGAVAGGSLAMALDLFKASFSLTILLTAIGANEEAAVCALYEAATAGDARSQYLAVLTDEGATAPEIEFVEHLLSNNIVNLLFFAWGDSEDVIENTTPEIDCAVCACDDPEFLFDFGVVQSGTPNVEGVDFVIRTEPWTSWHRLIMTLDAPGGCPCADYDIEVVSASPSFAGVPFGTIKNCALTDVWRYNDQGYGAVLDVWTAFKVDLGNTAETDVTFNIIRV